MRLLPHFEDLFCILGTCRAERSFVWFHTYVCEYGLESNPSVSSTLISTFLGLGCMCHVQNLLDRMMDHNDVPWDSLITGFVKHGNDHHALTLFHKMQSFYINPNPNSFVALLKACTNLKSIETGHRIHNQLNQMGLLETDYYVSSALISMYAKCGCLQNAQEVFDSIHAHNIVIWNSLITGYLEQGLPKEAFNCLEQMQYHGVSRDLVSLLCGLKACGDIGLSEETHKIHDEIVKIALEKETSIVNTLIYAYAKVDSLEEAQNVFVNFANKTLVSWTALISGYSTHGYGEDAIYWFEKMQIANVYVDGVTYVHALKACSNMKDRFRGQKLHIDIAKTGFLELNSFLGSALVDMYVKCGLLAEARFVFNRLTCQSRDVVSWTTLMGGYVEHEYNEEEALGCYKNMQQEGSWLDTATYLYALKACCNIQTSCKGQKLHIEITKKGWETEIRMCNTLVYMYVKYGLLNEAQDIFDKTSNRNLILWSSLIVGYAEIGQMENVCYTFDRMIGEGIRPDLVTFLCVLNACNHAGFVDKGQTYFNAINQQDLVPTLEHYTSLIDLFVRADQLSKAVYILRNMPTHPGIVIWHIVLAGSQKFGNVKLGKEALKHLTQAKNECVPDTAKRLHI